MKIIFLTDLDGTLLNFDNFSFEAIRADLLEFIKSGIDIIPVSSKTRPEMIKFYSALGVDLPFIYENGAGFCSDAKTSNQNDVILGRPVDELMQIWDASIPVELKADCKFLSAMEIEECSALLGLSGEPLALALARSYTALLKFTGDKTALTLLNIYVERAGLTLQKGGRVFCLSGLHNKASFINSFRQKIPGQKLSGQRIMDRPENIIVAFGDGNNDIPMLNAADFACIIPRPNGEHLPPDKITTKKIIASQPAPLGWIETAEAALATMSNIGDIHYG
ncbi:HAD-IIB family hydrolase [Alphaproteobacteria bacterium]|nr:HAD-IIB family hydrolase [Alphaproteobacteria bacterium]